MNLTCGVRASSHTLCDCKGPVADCGKPAVMVILTESTRIGCAGLEAAPYCAEHAPEQAHEARSSMSKDEFVIVNLRPPRRCDHGCPMCNAEPLAMNIVPNLDSFGRRWWVCNECQAAHCEADCCEVAS